MTGRTGASTGSGRPARLAESVRSESLDSREMGVDPAVAAPEEKLQVIIVGAGLIGGSLAKALKLNWERLGQLIIFDTDQATVEAATAEKVADAAYLLPAVGTNGAGMDSAASAAGGLMETAAKSVVTAGPPERSVSSVAGEKNAPLTNSLTAEMKQVLARADLVVFAVPVAMIGPLYRSLSPYTDALFTDVAGVKVPVMTALAGQRFIGGHPMAGTERTGYACSSAGLFENALYVLTPPASEGDPAAAVDIPEERPAAEAGAKPGATGSFERSVAPPAGGYAYDLESDLALLEEMVQAVGAIPLLLTAAEHDRGVAAISHLPHVLAAGLVNAVRDLQKTENADFMRLAAGGFRDITRIASSSANLWAGLAAENKASLLPAIDRLISRLEDFKKALASGDQPAVKAYFETAGQARGRLPSRGAGALQTDALIQIELADRPGEIAVIATLLAVRGINIQNIGILNARQYEGGRMHLYLSSDNQVEPALAALRGAGYECF